MCSLIGQQSAPLGLEARAQQKKEVMTTGPGTTGYTKKDRPGHLWGRKKVKKSVASA